MAIWLSGKELARERRKALRQKVRQLSESLCLSVILVGENEASKIYVEAKQTAADKAGIRSQLHHLPSDIAASDLSAMIQSLNQDETVSGILLQLPLPPHLDSLKHLQEIHPSKDVDGFHPLNAGLMAVGLSGMVPCTPLGIMHLMHHFQIPVEGSHAVVVGKSNIVGRPMAQLLLNAGATVTVCHSLTRDLRSILRQGDIIISAAGCPDLIGPECLGRPAYLIDVGINRLADGRVCGDMKTQLLYEQDLCRGITPVPGGVGPLTIQCLLENTYKAKVTQFHYSL